MSQERVLDTLARIARTLTPGDLDHTLDRITAAAVEVLPGVHYASVTILHEDGSLGTAAPTDPLLLDLDAAQYELREGPCYEAAVDVAYVTSPHLAADERFARYAAVANAEGVRAQAAVRLFDLPRPRSRGALNLYSREVGSFADMDFLSLLFAHQAATALDYAREVENLQDAMKTRQLIGHAVGIVMERYNLTEERAFAFLARVSQTRNVKLRLVAQEIVDEASTRAES